MRLAVTVLLMSLAASAAEASGVFGIGAHVASLNASDATENKFLVGGHVRLRLGSCMGIEASVDYWENTFEQGSPAQKATVKSMPVLLSLTTDIIPQSPVSPYVLGGGGWYFNRIEMKTDYVTIEDEDVRFGYHLGGGILVKATDRLTIHGDYRYTNVDIQVKDLDLNFDANGHMITGGVTFYF